MKASHSKLTSFRRCRRQFHWTYNLGRDAGSSTGQKVGSIGHAVLAHWYSHMREPNIQRDCMRHVELLGNQYNIDHDDIDRLARAINRYIEYSDEYDVFDVIDTEVKIERQLGAHTIEGYVDLLVRYPDGRQMCIDHKFMKRPDVSGIELDQQLTMYCWLTNSPAAMLNAVNVTASKTTKMASVIRDITNRTPEYMSLFLADIEAQLDEVQEYENHPDREKYSYPSPMISCSWDCNFYSTCKEYQRTGNRQLVTDLPPRIFDKIIIKSEE